MQAEQERDKRIISTPNRIDEKYIRMLKGERSDTKELNINIKTLTLSHLRDLEAANELTQFEKEIVKNYSLMSPSFASIVYLFFGEQPHFKISLSKIMHKQKFQINADKEKSPPFKEARVGLRKYCLAYYRSNHFIKEFLKSSRMNIKNKLIIIKFLNKIECLPLRVLRKKDAHWKNSELGLLRD